ncbi:hypothetical protein PT974_09728 [Cladobotryum mycophilum]|uniref:NAD dependent epimerase/dehydratase n=1 Tax=Cladobotryum mycophilum TaxID=491253 RepID=A0ABR0SIC3_9HYPO
MSEPNTRSRVTPMRVIVCGVHRTGSASTRAALRQLGFNDCYHMQTVVENVSTDPQIWVRAIEAKYTGKDTFGKKDWDDVLGNSQACVDLPAALFATELAEIYPDAKVVILNRDPEKWYGSVLESTYKFGGPPQGILAKLIGAYVYMLNDEVRNFVKLNQAINTLAFGYDHGKEKYKALAWFNGMYKEFRDHISAERRIEFCVQDGWKPLCEHLGVPIPMIKDEKDGKMVEAPFPRVNDRVSFNNRVAEYRIVTLAQAHKVLLALIGRLALFGLVLYLCGGLVVGNVRWAILPLKSLT